jgi:hypothetical protein
MDTKRVLIVAHRTAATPRLIECVRERASRGDCAFTLLVPRNYWDPDTDEAAAVLELALPVLEDACGARVDGIIGASDPFEAVRTAVAEGAFGEIIVSTLPTRVSQWLRRDLPSRCESLGLPVTVVTAEGPRVAAADAGRTGA